MVQHRRSANEGAALTFKPSFFPLAADAAALPAVSHLPCLFDAASEDGLLRHRFCASGLSSEQAKAAA